MVELRKQGAIDVVDSGERITTDTVEELGNVLQDLDESGQPKVVLDMQHAALLDSKGLELLLDLQDQYQRKGGVLKIANANALCREILRLTGVDSRLEIHGDVGSAVRSFLT